MSKKRLHKSSDVIISGVCGGIAEYFSIDATLVRIFAVVLTLAGLGLPVVLYVICMLVFPPDPAAREGYVDARAEATQPPCERLHATATATADEGRVSRSGPIPVVSAVARSHRSLVPIAGVVLIGIGIMALLCNVIHISLWRFWPAVLIMAGLVGLFTPATKGWSLERAGAAIVLITIGLALLAWMLQIIHMRIIVLAFLDLWPAFLIVVGLAVIGASRHNSIFTLASSLVFSATIIFGLWIYGGLDLSALGTTSLVMDDGGFHEFLFDAGFER